MTEEHEEAREGRSSWNVLLGAAFILGGLALLADRTGWLDIGPLWPWWPLILIGLGLANLLFDRGAEERETGIWLLAAGIYCGIGVWEPYGLSWATGWPVMIVALGATFLLDGGGSAGGVWGCGRRRSRSTDAEGSGTADRTLHTSTEGNEVRHGN